MIEILTNIAYIVAFNHATLCPAWTRYDLDPCEVVMTNRAPISFHADPRVNTATSEDYAGSGYDRGHMAPAADFNFDAAALWETYSYVNVCPQDPKLNRGSWSRFEREIRELAPSGRVEILTFPIWFPGLPTNYVGRVAVPHAFEKIAWGKFGVRRGLFYNFRSGMVSER